jgi:hyperosmotically inducible protein
MKMTSMKMRDVLLALTVGLALAGTAACSATRTQKTAGEQIDDSVVLGKVKAALIADPTTSAHEIDVEVYRGIVQLNGFVDSSAEKSRAAALARDVHGVADVQNNLSVRSGTGTVGEVIDDATLTAKVKAALIESPDTKAHQINVESKAGVVHLSGFVNNATAKEAATSVAKSVSGVKEVRNEISVKTS